MGKWFRCWRINTDSVFEVKVAAKWALLLALICPKFDYVAVPANSRELFMAHMKEMIASNGYRQHVTRLRRLLFGGWSNFIPNVKTAQAKRAAAATKRTMSLSAKRARRDNAGSKMHRMIEEERAKIERGEIAASDDDADVDFANKADVEDIIDSDFAETDSEAEQAADDASKEIEAMVERVERRRQRKAAKKHIVPRFAGAKQRALPKPKSVAVDKDERSGSVASDKSDGDGSTVGRRKVRLPELAVRVSSRKLAVRKAQESEALEVERNFLAEAKRGRRKHSHTHDLPELTQEQLLEEAKQTEISNVEKLKDFQEQEAEEKRQQRILGARKTPLIIHPVAHWKSTLRNNDLAEADTVTEQEKLSIGESRVEYALDSLDDSRYPLNPWTQQISLLPPKICPVTGLPARYFHPRARVPYANLQAYRVLEELVRGEHAYFYDIGVWSSTAITE
ncbi:Vacuolar protein sorting-associated protein 72 [Coemansia sp. S142-1]|nr:Vacuolar protein sorting-associated protein 72 [Coemansia sp. S142-1]